ncbi:MAG: helix-turn-helix domain-containing protein [Sulfurimonadaceae bacterium]|nr:helix-turn-helix domain-containing protein [Sulfurimonadaceae bacterium]
MEAPWKETGSVPVKKKGRSKSDGENVVKSVCKELGITQKKLAQILEIPEGTVSSWAVKNEIPRLGKKAIEFYIQMQKNEEIVKRFREMIALVNESGDSD